MKLLNKLKRSKITKHSWLLPHLLVSAFLLSQVALITHKAEHLTTNADSGCLLCINSVDNAINTQPIDLVVIAVIYIAPDSSNIFYTDLDISLPYSSRAPPLA